MVKAIDWRMRPPFGDWKESYLYTKGSISKKAIKPRAIEEWNIDYLIEDMEEAGVVAAMAPHRLGQDPEHLVQLQNLYPGRFYGFLHCNPFAMEQAMCDIEKYVIHGPLYGVVMEPGQFFLQEPMPADDERLYPVYEKCQANNIPLNLSFGGLYCAKLEYYNPIYLDRVAITFPDLKIICGHGGWPYTTQICHVAYQRPHVYLSPDVYMMPIHPGYMDYVIAANHTLKEKILFGSAYPAFTPQDAIHMYTSLPLSEDALEHVLYRNAARILGLEK